MKKIGFVIITFLVLSCNEAEITVPETTLVNLEYPKGYGQSGNSITSTVGFGYDATGICDTLSVKNRILNLNQESSLIISNVNYSGPGIIVSGINYPIFLWTIGYYPNRVDEPTNIFLSHFNSLFEIALGTENIDENCAYAYYSCFQLLKHIHYFINPVNIESELTEEFKNDIKILTPDEILEKYGTHAIIDAYTGSKFEVLYKCELLGNYSGDVSNLLYKRVAEYFHQIPGLILDETYSIPPQKNEQLVFNTLGFNEKLFGVINATDNNSNNVSIDLSNVFSSGSNFQFVKIGKGGLIPLYELVSDTEKKAALKDLIDEATGQ